MEEKYIKLLVDKCLTLKKDDALFISYPLIIRDFVWKLVSYVKKIGIKDIYLDEKNDYEVYYVLENYDIKEIKKSPLFNAKVWDEYAKKKAAFLMLESEIPSLMENIDSTKLTLAANLKLTSKPLYRKLQLKGEIPWCIAAVPNELWAQKILSKSKRPLEELWNYFAHICMFDHGDASKNWDKYLNLQKEKEDKLNALKIEKLYYHNKLGTNLEISLSPKTLWRSASSDKWLVNMPSYEIFTTPIYNKTNGIVYSSKPLIYNGQTIDNFYLKFKNGKVVTSKALVGDKTLKELINSESLMAFLGEVALVDYNSPISNTKLIFSTTLIDENAACHIALGSGFSECLKGGTKMSSNELKKLGVNTAKNHVDFMIGTKDLTIEADTKDGHIIIMKDGNLII